MKQLQLFILVIYLVAAAGTAKAEGESWWWHCKQDDFVVSAEVDYGSSPQFTISGPDKDGKQQVSYYILGKLKIKEFRNYSGSSCGTGHARSCQGWIKL